VIGQATLDDGGRMKQVLLSATAFAALSASAFAADLPSWSGAAPPAPPVFTWAGA
jgi:opacity protein-like surface antigen